MKLPAWKPVLQAGFRLDSNRENLKTGPPAGLGRIADSEAFPTRIRPKTGPEA
jgi:hypothetical protein